ncbi:MAG: class I tRNA ligase family protein [Caldilineaceae bacterium]
MRYWAAGTAPGKDAIISEEKMQAGAKLVNKLWNVARFSQRFVLDLGDEAIADPAVFSPADRWLLARTRQLVQRVTDAFDRYDYAAANHELESFFWTEFTDNYLEMAKQRLYQPDSRYHLGARMALRQALLTLLKLYAPILPYVTDAIYQALFATAEGCASIHRARWPQGETGATHEDQAAIAVGEALVQIATAVRRYKSEAQLALGTELARLDLMTPDPLLVAALPAAEEDLKSITRAQAVHFSTPGATSSAAIHGGVAVVCHCAATDLPQALAA